MADRPRRPAATLQDAALLAAVRAIPRTGKAPAAAVDALLAALAGAGGQAPDRARPVPARAQAAVGAFRRPIQADTAAAAFDRLDDLLAMALEMVDALSPQAQRTSRAE
jgi:hypothetical protein